ncbi:hypothetical protein [Actinomycetospora straminea]|uniref:Uncharacterized protein n=1 Tax=Actinomycetospora straminea TaxID=663607 RepID=A0ABP9EK93_9PSEU|nr:hypothetical protein [Actinomycetospora straminea]MDD7936443.1 hypothetical protein [Actinomycetospora straminea]
MDDPVLARVGHALDRARQMVDDATRARERSRERRRVWRLRRTLVLGRPPREELTGAAGSAEWPQDVGAASGHHRPQVDPATDAVLQDHLGARPAEGGRS